MRVSRHRLDFFSFHTFLLRERKKLLHADRRSGIGYLPKNWDSLRPDGSLFGDVILRSTGVPGGQPANPVFPVAGGQKRDRGLYTLKNVVRNLQPRTGLADGRSIWASVSSPTGTQTAPECEPAWQSKTVLPGIRKRTGGAPSPLRTAPFVPSGKPGLAPTNGLLEGLLTNRAPRRLFRTWIRAGSRGDLNMKQRTRPAGRILFTAEGASLQVA